MASKKVDFKDVSPAWKVLQMKLHEEEVNKKVAAPNSLKKPFKKKKSKYKFVSPQQQQQASNSHETKKTEQEPEKPETKNKPEPDEDGFTKVVTKKDRKLENRKRRLEESAASTSSTSSEQIQQSKRSKIIDIPVLIKDNERGPPTPVLALDCEYVGAGSDGTIDILARVSIVNENGKIVYDKHVKPTEPIKDYRTFVSGIRPADLEKGESFVIVQKEVASILQDRIVVGHAIHNDFRVLKFNHKSKLIRDTAKCRILKDMIGKKGLISLKLLAKTVLGIDIQQGEHDSITDARVALRLYLAVKDQWEKEIKRFHWQKS